MKTNWLQLDQSKPLTFRKESLPAGRIVKGDKEWSITPANLSQIASTANAMLADEILIPFTKGHDGWMETENKLGKIIAATVDKNSDGVDALFLDVTFDNQAAADLALSGEVSVSIPTEWKDGKGKLWSNPLVHLASTVAPVVAGMDSWAALAASFTKDTNMNPNYELGADFDQAAVDSFFGKIKTEAPDLFSRIQAAAKPEEKVELSYPPLVVRSLRDAREQQLDAMVAKGEISPAVKGELVLAFCTDKQVGLELSHNSTGEQYDLVVKIAKLASKSQPVSPIGRSSTPGKGEMELAHAGGTSNGLAAVIDQMAKDHAARFGNRN